MRFTCTLVLLLAGWASTASGQRSTPAGPPESRPANEGYRLGPGDQIAVHIMNFDELPDKPVQVDLNGSIRLPVVGRVTVSGLTTTQVETELAKRLKNYLLHPDVSVSVAEFRSQPVSVIGAVKSPGVQQVQGRRTLLEMLSLAGGLDANAGSSIRITRSLSHGRIPLPGAVDDPTGEFSIAEVNLKSILDAKNPQQNILIEPHDVISVPRADTVYVIGEVSKAGGFPLNENDDVTVLQALSMAGGLSTMARAGEARILRRTPGAVERTEIPVNLNKILSGQTSDVRMQPEDILFVPNNVPKRAALRGIEAAIQMGTGIVIWRRP